MDKAFALSRKHSLTNHLWQKEIYDEKIIIIIWESLQQGDLLWL